MENNNKTSKSSKVIMRETLLSCLLGVRNLHLESPFGNDVVSLDFFQYWVLDFIDDNPSSVKFISNASNIDRRVVNSNVTHLLKMGLVQKKKDSQDGREMLIYLSDYGVEILQEVRKQIDDMLSFTKQKYSIKEERTLTTFFEDFSASIKETIEK